MGTWRQHNYYMTSCRVTSFQTSQRHVLTHKNFLRMPKSDAHDCTGQHGQLHLKTHSLHWKSQSNGFPDSESPASTLTKSVKHGDVFASGVIQTSSPRVWRTRQQRNGQHNSKLRWLLLKPSSATFVPFAMMKISYQTTSMMSQHIE